MGRKKKYATPEEARKGNNEKRTKKYRCINNFMTVKTSVEEAPEHIKDFATRNRFNHDMFKIDEVDIYQYALIGVDQTIHTLVQTIKFGDETKKNKTNDFGSPTRKRQMILLLQQLRFRNWLIDKAHLVSKLTEPFDFYDYLNRTNQTQQEEEDDANTTAFTESDSEQEGTL